MLTMRWLFALIVSLAVSANALADTPVPTPQEDEAKGSKAAALTLPSDAKDYVLQSRYTELSRELASIQSEIDQIQQESSLLDEFESRVIGRLAIEQDPEFARKRGALSSNSKAKGPDHTALCHATWGLLDDLENAYTDSVRLLSTPLGLRLPAPLRNEIYGAITLPSPPRDAWVDIRQAKASLVCDTAESKKDWLNDPLQKILDKELAGNWFGSQVKDILTNPMKSARQNITNALKVRQSREAALKSAIETYTTEIENRDEKDNIHDWLSIATLCMVGALVLLYVVTLFANAHTQSLVFRQRILVEMIGMGFLLLTIIILGTGEKIEKAVLGTLLGTVAGYIFGQQVRAGQNSRRRQKRFKRNRKSNRSAVPKSTEKTSSSDKSLSLAAGLQRAASVGDIDEVHNGPSAQPTASPAKPGKPADPQ